MRWIWTVLFTSLLFGQPQYPADSLLAPRSVPLIHKAGLLPIAAWQRLSYNTDLLNCQFYPSCSNYGAEAIKKYGLFRGSVLASDRIVRCNPFALPDCSNVIRGGGLDVDSIGFSAQKLRDSLHHALQINS